MEDEKKVETPEPTAEEKIALAVKAKEEEWQAKFKAEVNKTAAALRKQSEAELEKSKMTEAERIAAENKEKYDAMTKRLGELEAEKSLNIKKSKLNEAKLPSIFMNDARIVNAKDEEVDDVVKSVAKEWEQLTKELTKSKVQDTQPKFGDNKPEVQEYPDAILAKAPWLKK